MALMQLFGMVKTYKMMELKRNLSLAAYLSARKTNLQSKRYLQARRVHGFSDSPYCLTLSICIEVDVLILHLSFEIIFCFLAAAILFPAFQPGFNYIRFF